MRGRRVTAAIALAGIAPIVALAATASSAQALPTVNVARLVPRLPIAGPLVSFGCGNPANHRSPGGTLLPAAMSRVGSGPLSCFGEAVGGARGSGPKVMSGPTGYGPSQIQSAYKLGGLNSGGRTVAIVDAFDDPNAEADLATYRSTTAFRPARPRTAASRR